eukprot:PhF_6_TR24828/c0_g1_i2/m.34234
MDDEFELPPDFGTPMPMARPGETDTSVRATGLRVLGEKRQNVPCVDQARRIKELDLQLRRERLEKQQLEDKLKAEQETKAKNKVSEAAERQKRHREDEQMAKKGTL